MPRPALKCRSAVGGECAAAERGVADTRGGADGELAVLDAALDAFAEAHQSGEAEVDRGLERVVAFGFRERLAVERHRLCADSPGRRPDAPGRLRARCPAQPSARACSSKADRAAGVAGDVVHVGGEEETPARVVRRSSAA